MIGSVQMKFMGCDDDFWGCGIIWNHGIFTGAGQTNSFPCQQNEDFCSPRVTRAAVLTTSYTAYLRDLASHRLDLPVWWQWDLRIPEVIKQGNGKYTISGWWYTYPSEKYESVGVIIPNIRKNNPNVPVTTNQISFDDLPSELNLHG